jgi:hypothetical protein
MLIGAHSTPTNISSPASRAGSGVDKLKQFRWFVKCLDNRCAEGDLLHWLSGVRSRNGL